MALKILVGSLLRDEGAINMREEIKPLFEIACERATQLYPIPKAFELKHLFTKQEWEQLSNDFRRDLGREFSYAVSKGMIEGLRHDGENQQHHNMYLKS